MFLYSGLSGVLCFPCCLSVPPLLQNGLMQTVLLIRCAGVGLGYCVLNSLVCIYYNVIIALALLYLFTSLRSNLLWASCDNDWNTKTCGDPIWFNTSGQPATACSCCIFCLHCFLNSFKSLISKLMNVQCSALVL